VDDSGIWMAAIDEQQQHQRAGYPDDLITLFSIPLDEVVVPYYVIRIVENFRRRLEGDSM
jgi:hypothetical protein